MAFVFQYGSNCSSERLNSDDRLQGDAEQIGWASTVDNYELTFDVWSTKNDCAASDIIPSGDEPVEGVLYEVPDYLIARETAQQRHRKSFDQIEGPAYERRIIRVRKRDGEEVEAITYTVKDPVRNLQTNSDYVAHIINGLREHGASEAYIRKVKRIAESNNPQIEQVIRDL
jgi:hypothetical protein